MFKTLVETIKSSTARKVSVDNLIMVLSEEKDDEDNAEDEGDVNYDVDDGEDGNEEESNENF